MIANSIKVHRCAIQGMCIAREVGAGAPAADEGAYDIHNVLGYVDGADIERERATGIGPWRVRVNWSDKMVCDRGLSGKGGRHGSRIRPSVQRGSKMPMDE